MVARTHVAPRAHSSPRARSSSSSSSSSRSIGSSITRYANRLTKRDYQILLDLHEHRILTTPQIYELHFHTFTRASKRMLQLYRLGLVERFRPFAPVGSAPWHYTLDEPGARVVAARLGIEFSEFPFKKGRIFDVVASPRLRHRVECNDVFARMAQGCRLKGWRLTWIGERRAAHQWDEFVRPDGIGRICTGDREVSFFLEYDRGTENHGRLEGKIARYQVVGRADDGHDALLFVFPSAARERAVQRSLPSPGFTLATAIRADVLRDPLGPVWLPLRHDRRHPLLDLPLEPRATPG